MHGEVVVSPNPKIISSIIKQSEYLDKELLSKANNKLYTLDEFNNAGKNQSQIFLVQTMFMSIPRLSQVKGGTLLYIDKSIKYKLCEDLNIFEKKMIESTFIEILNKKQKNLIIVLSILNMKLKTLQITTWCHY